MGRNTLSRLKDFLANLILMASWVCRWFGLWSEIKLLDYF